MPPVHYTDDDYTQMKTDQRFKQLAEFRDDFGTFTSFVNDPANTNHKKFGPYAMAQVRAFSPEVEKEVGPAANPGLFSIFLEQGLSQNFVAASKSGGGLLVWSCWRSEEERRKNDVDGAGCLRTLGALAIGTRTGVGLSLPGQEDKAFMWKAPSVHPLQVLENAYQRIVQKAGLEADDPIKAQADTLARYFIMDPGRPESFKYQPLDRFDGNHLSAVKMNHLIDTFYLFRLLVNYRLESSASISEADREVLRVDLSGDLTKLLHNGDRAKMGWLSDWLATKIGELGQKINKLNAPNGKKRVIFFLKGGHALNYFLGTPEKGENDWDTQVVIDPSLKAEDWYQCLSEVHDEMLVALKTFKTEFTELVQHNSPQFAEYLKGNTGAKAAEDDEVDENEAGDVSSQSEDGKEANCKAELIDIGIPRRDSASALEEWTHLSSPGALLESSDVIYPHREYYLNEYLMMVRDAFLPNAEVRKAPKRIKRLGLILNSDLGRKGVPSLAALPETAKQVAAIKDKGRQELLGFMISQFVEAYNLKQDKQLASHFDTECVAMTSNPPKLIAGLAELLDDAQKATATDVGVAHGLSTLMDEHWQARNEFFEGKLRFFDEFVSELARLTNQGLQKVHAQFAIAGSYAARLHARHLRLKPVGLEPIRRILVKLQCALGSDRAQVMNAVRGTITDAAGKYKLTVTDVSDGNKQSLLVYWGSPVAIGKFTYAPLVMKVRVAEQKVDQLPVLASIDGIPVLDLRYLVADYLKKTSKVDERGSRRVLASATAAVSEMLSRFDFDSDDSD